MIEPIQSNVVFTARSSKKTAQNGAMPEAGSRGDYNSTIRNIERIKQKELEKVKMYQNGTFNTIA